MFDAAHLQMYLHYLFIVINLFLALGGGTLVVSMLPKIPTLTTNFFTWIEAQAAHVKNQYVAGMLQRCLDLVKGVVLMFENTEIESIKAKIATGKLSPEDLPAALADVKKNAVAAVQGHMNAQGLSKDLLKIVFGGDQSSMTKWISDTIEAVVSQLPSSGLQTAKGAGAAAIDVAKAVAAGVVKNVVAPPAPSSP